ncbi:Arc family DNA-binding protein [Comamonas thiooxydans]|uniref:Arc family DNA-binding protein n=1 Tax=Comamonas thiooxydans TaxID=363952 RepID=UPI00057B57C5|nr:Arc family DNA-binding protein [Comamonas thiooxydans]
MATNQTQADWQKTALRMPRELHQQVHEAAKADDRTFNSQIVAFLKECIAARQVKEAKHGLQA